MTPWISITLAFACVACSHPAAPKLEAAPKPEVAPANPAAAPVAAPGAAASGTPCFPTSPPLVASKIHEQLEKYASSLYLGSDDSHPAPTTFGTCKVVDNVITAADGSLVGELGCGMRVVKRGILDDLGLQVGDRGQQVLDRKHKPVKPMTCTANGPDQVRCWFEREDADPDTDPSAYVVAGKLGEDVLTGAAAMTYFGSRELVELHVSFWCH